MTSSDSLWTDQIVSTLKKAYKSQTAMNISDDSDSLDTDAIVKNIKNLNMQPVDVLRSNSWFLSKGLTVYSVPAADHATPYNHLSNMPCTTVKHSHRIYQVESGSETDFEAGDLMREPPFDDQDYVPEPVDSQWKKGQPTDNGRTIVEASLTGWGAQIPQAID